MIGLATMPLAMIIVPFLENARQTGWQTGPWQLSIPRLVAIAARRS
jgi:hypothetical protein